MRVCSTALPLATTDGAVEQPTVVKALLSSHRGVTFPTRWRSTLTYESHSTLSQTEIQEITITQSLSLSLPVYVLFGRTTESHFPSLLCHSSFFTNMLRSMSITRESTVHFYDVFISPCGSSDKTSVWATIRGWIVLEINIIM